MRDNTDHRMTLEDPDKFDKHALTNITRWWGHNTQNRTTFPASRNELQAIVNAAALQYGIYAECTCRDEDWEPTCPTHGYPELEPDPGFCRATKRDGYGALWACFRTDGHDGFSHAYQRAAGALLPEGHPARGLA